MKYFYYAAVREFDSKYYAQVVTTHESENIVNRFPQSLYAIVEPCRTRKRAEELVKVWNDCYRANGMLYGN